MEETVAASITKKAGKGNTDGPAHVAADGTDGGLTVDAHRLMAQPCHQPMPRVTRRMRRVAEQEDASPAPAIDADPEAVGASHGQVLDLPVTT
ncbi:hypothetical protein [Streptomyces sp. R41]|uniref:Uncharacterized protein n=1 Tax=Streptomyces sp. R41 TaxID=3238632 RepID=A0AB39RVN3_9ACTN